MVFKTAQKAFYPLSIRDNYNATVTDYRQTKVSTSSKDLTVYIYDIDKTPTVNDNPIEITMNRIKASNGSIRGYEYISNNVKVSRAISAASSFTLNIPDLRDPNAKIIFYGGGTGEITYKSVNYNTVLYGKNVSININFTVTPSTFVYPTSNVNVSVVPKFIGVNVDVPNNWIFGWLVSYEGGTVETAIDGNTNFTGGYFSFKKEYNSGDSNKPKATVVLRYLEAKWEINEDNEVEWAEVYQPTSAWLEPGGPGPSYTPGSDAYYTGESYYHTSWVYYYSWSGGSGWVEEGYVNSDMTLNENAIAWERYDTNEGFILRSGGPVKVSENESSDGNWIAFDWDYSTVVWAAKSDLKCYYAPDPDSQNYHSGTINYDGSNWQVYED